MRGIGFVRAAETREEESAARALIKKNASESDFCVKAHAGDFHILSISALTLRGRAAA
jgi:hypothetical protein